MRPYLDRLAICVAVLLVSLTTTTLLGMEYFVSPNADAAGDGSLSKPWDLQTALTAVEQVQPGDTVWLLGGVYRGPFVSGISGTMSQPVIVRNYPGQWAILNDSWSTTLEYALPSAGDAPCTLTHAVPDGSVILIDSEELFVHNRVGSRYTCVRGWGGTPVAPHAPGSKVERTGQILQSKGNYVWWWGFMITSSRTARLTTQSYRGTGLDMVGKGNKAINLLVHNAGHPGIGFWNQGEGGEIHGCLIWGNGIADSSQSGNMRGAGIYAQNNSGTVEIGDNIVFRNLTQGFHIYTENGRTDGFRVVGNLVFDNMRGQVLSSGGNVYPQKGLVMTDNVIWERLEDDFAPVRLGYHLQNDIEFRRNYLAAGKTSALLVYGWQGSVVLTENTIFGPLRLLNFSPIGASTTWDKNSYYSSGSRPFILNEQHTYTFSDWKRITGVDTASTVSSETPPDRILLRPNKYESGRGHVVVLNWSDSSSAEVDLGAILARGSSFKILDAQNVLGVPVLTGVYDGGRVSLPMRLAAVSPIEGQVVWDKPTSHTAAVLNVFVVLTVPGRRADTARPGERPRGIPRN